ncbi:hypothetical protein BDD12DRAFT_827936 [Trichophaea hybrida]|nr:hypothetical protein BDD12DRAFT_827936 [Trichophaea hybrida]
MFPYLPLAHAAPVPNTTIVHWTPSPKTRGTNDILISCLATLGLCVWTALHLNIDPIETTPLRVTIAYRFLTKLLWSITALIAPEIVLSVALHQYLVAQRYRYFVNKNQQGRGISLKTSFYAIMGGFAVKIGGHEQTVRMEPVGLRETGMMEKIRRFPEAKIEDKSKADVVAKGLACVQAGWIVLQCLGRKLQGLPITPLEINTVVHVLNAVVMYAIWWEKPVDVGEPSVIHTYSAVSEEKSFIGIPEAHERVKTAYLSIAPALTPVLSRADVEVPNVYAFLGKLEAARPWVMEDLLDSLYQACRRCNDSEILGAAFNTACDAICEVTDEAEFVTLDQDRKAHEDVFAAINSIGIDINVARMVARHDGLYPKGEEWTHKDGLCKAARRRMYRILGEAAATARGRWKEEEQGQGQEQKTLEKAVAEAVHQALLQDLCETAYTAAEDLDAACNHATAQGELTTQLHGARDVAFEAAYILNPFMTITTAPGEAEKEKVWKRFTATFCRELVTSQVIWSILFETPRGQQKNPNVLGMVWRMQHRVLLVFGMHALKWNSGFPTEVEGLMWRVATCVGTGGVVPILVLCLGNAVWPRDRFFWKNTVCMGFGILTGVVFVSARLYLIVESFISLRALPVSAYNTVQWAESFPHL